MTDQDFRVLNRLMALVCGPPHLHTCCCEHCGAARLRAAVRRRDRVVAEARRQLEVETRRNVAADRLMRAAVENGTPVWSLPSRA